MTRKCHNYAGKVCVVNPEPTGTVCHVVVQLPQVRNCVYYRGKVHPCTGAEALYRLYGP